MVKWKFEILLIWPYIILKRKYSKRRYLNDHFDTKFQIKS